MIGKKKLSVNKESFDRINNDIRLEKLKCKIESYKNQLQEDISEQSSEDEQ